MSQVAVTFGGIKGSCIPSCCPALWCFSTPLINQIQLNKRYLNFTQSIFLSYLLEYVYFDLRCIPAFKLFTTVKIIEGIWYIISRNPTITIYSFDVSMTSDGTIELSVYDLQHVP